MPRLETARAQESARAPEIAQMFAVIAPIVAFAGDVVWAQETVSPPEISLSFVGMGAMTGGAVRAAEPVNPVTARDPGEQDPETEIAPSFDEMAAIAGG